MSDTALNKIIQYGTNAERLAFTPDPAASSQVLYIWYETDNAPDTYVWDGSAWVQINTASGSGITELTGDVTAGPGSGSQVATIANDAVTFAKMQNITSGVLLGRTTAAAGDTEEITPGASMKFAAGALNSRVVQIVTTQSSAYSSGSTQIPADDTIPQNTEGVEFITLAITPTNTANVLIIEALLFLSSDTSARRIVAALFQDTTADALAVGLATASGINVGYMVGVNYSMVAGTTSSTTFKIRAGLNSTGTIGFNGVSGGRQYGAIAKSFIKITEVTV